MKVNYTPPGDEPEKKPDLLQPGWHSFAVLDCFTTNQAGQDLVTKEGDPYLKLRVEELSTGAVIYHSLFFSENGTAKLNAFLFATGLAGNRFEEIEVAPSDFVSKRFRGLVGMETYNGRQYNRIERVQPLEKEPEPEPKNDPDLEEDLPF